MTGLINPVFDDENQSYTESRDAVDDVSCGSSSSLNEHSPFPRPQSLNLSSTDNRHEFLLHNKLCTSDNSLDQNQGLYSNGLFNSVVTNEVGSSLSMDSGNPLGTQSLESLDDRGHANRNMPSGQACAAAATPSTRCVELFCVVFALTEFPGLEKMVMGHGLKRALIALSPFF